MILKIFLLLAITLSFTFSQQDNYFTITENFQGGFNVNNSAGKMLLEFTKRNTDSLNLKALGFIFSELKYFRMSLNNQVDSIKETKKINTDSRSIWRETLNYLPILIPVLTLWVAFLQIRLSKFNSKYQMFDQKFNVYENTDEFIKKLLSGEVEISDCTEFDKKVRIAKFIYSDKINILLNKILERGFKIAELKANIKLFNNNDADPDGFNKNLKLIKQKSDIMMESREYRDNLDEIFKDKLKIKN